MFIIQGLMNWEMLENEFILLEQYNLIVKGQNFCHSN